jgi:transposase
MGFKEGKDRNQVVIYSLDEIVNPQSMARVIDRFVEVVDLGKLGFTNCEFAETGRPPYSSAALCKLHVYGYENGTRSSRKLEKETHRNVEVMWMIESLTPDHKTIAEFRRKNIRPLQKLFKEFVKLCKSWGLVGGELIAVDGSKFKASNNKKNNFSKKKIDDRLARLEAKIQNYFDESEAADKSEDAEEVKDAAGLQELLKRKELYEEYKKQLEDSGENELSTVDPDARLMGNNRGGVDMAYNVQSAVDGKHDIIVDFDVSMNPSDQNQLGNMVKKVKKTLKLRRFTALADKGYYNGEDLRRVKRLKVTAIVAKQKPSNPKDQPEQFWTDKFTYDEETDTYTCPEGHTLSSGNKKGAKRRNYCNKAACADCPHSTECIKGEATHRTVTRSQYSKIYDETDKRHEENKELYKRRQMIVEHPFGTVKHTMNGGYFLLRTRRKVRAEVALLFLGYNLKRVYNILGFEGLMERLNSLSFPAFGQFLIKWGNFVFFNKNYPHMGC